MTFCFTDIIPGGLVHTDPILISGPASLELPGKEYLTCTNSEVSIFEIRYEYHCSPFREALITDNILAVGHEEHFYLFNLVTQTNTLRLKMEGYFGRLYINDEYFYIADAGGLHCIDKHGKIIWKNGNLAIDGVIIHNFTEDRIFGSGEWDPPGGWRNFVLDKASGVLLK